MANTGMCEGLEVALTDETRNYLIVPDHERCGVAVRYYGRGCQFMELRSLRREVLGAATTRYTWDRNSRALCRIGETRSQPGTSRMVLRMLEPCEEGIPLAHWLVDEECPIRVVNNHGLCGGGRRSVVNAWSRFFEVFDLRIQRMEMDYLSDFEGSSNVRLVEFLVELQHTFAGSALHFSEVDLDVACPATSTGSAELCDFTFGCRRGCGRSHCGCTEPCDDGTQSLYVSYYCPDEGGGTYHIAYWLAGGQRVGNIELPALAGTGGSCARIVATGDTLYVLAGENPVEVFEVPLDDNGLPQEQEAQSVATLLSSTGSVTGTPAGLVLDGDDLYALVADPAGGSRLYRYADWTTPLQEFSTLLDYERLAVCGSRILVGGFGAQPLYSEDSGETFDNLAPPVGFGSPVGSFQINDMAFVDGRIWLALSDGRVFHSADEGFTWGEVALGLSSVESLSFLGNDVGWIAGSDGLQSTWLGGLDGDLWTGESPRLANWPCVAGTNCTPVGARKAVAPGCANGTLAANTVAVLLDDGRLMMGRARVSGV